MTHSTEEGTPVSVTVDDASLDAIDEVADRLRERGLRVHQVLASIGIVTGSVPSVQDVAALNDVPGVASVDLQEGVDLGPPDQEIQ